METNSMTNKRSSCDNAHGKRQSFWKKPSGARILCETNAYSIHLSLVIGIGSVDRASCLLYEPFLSPEKKKKKKEVLESTLRVPMPKRETVSSSQLQRALKDAEITKRLGGRAT